MVNVPTPGPYCSYHVGGLDIWSAHLYLSHLEDESYLHSSTSRRDCTGRTSA